MEVDPMPDPRNIKVAYFYPAGCRELASLLDRRLCEVIDIYRLGFCLYKTIEMEYPFGNDLDLSLFENFCRSFLIEAAIIISGPAENGPQEQEIIFNKIKRLLTEKKLSLQIVSKNDLKRGYTFLNLALNLLTIGMDSSLNRNYRQIKNEVI